MLRAAQEGSPLDFIAINGEHSKAPRDTRFIGPLKRADRRYLAQLIELLDKEPFADITEARAVAMAGDSNPWVACLGLSRLKRLKVATADHFLLAMAGRAEEDIPNLVRDMFDPGRNAERLPRGFDDRFVFRGLRLGQQKAALAALLPNNARSLNSYIDLPRWQAAVRAYLPEARADRQRQEVIPLLEAVLQLK